MALGAPSIIKLISRKSRESKPSVSDSVSCDIPDCCGTPDITPDSQSSTKPSGKVPADTDHDGMPDDWEKKYDLNPKDASDNSADCDQDGYTNVEEYLNGLVARPKANGE